MFENLKVCVQISEQLNWHLKFNSLSPVIKPDTSSAGEGAVTDLCVRSSPQFKVEPGMWMWGESGAKLDSLRLLIDTWGGTAKNDEKCSL